MELSTHTTRNLFYGDYFSVGIDLCVMPLAVTMTAASFLVINFIRTTFDLASVWPLSKNIFRLVCFRMQNEILGAHVRWIAVLESYMHRFTLGAFALWNRTKVLDVFQSVIAHICTIDVAALALALGNKWTHRKIDIAVLFPSVVVHSAPGSTETKFLAAFYRARQAGFKALGSSSGASSLLRMKRWIAVHTPAMVMGLAPSSFDSKVSASVEATWQAGFGVFHWATIADFKYRFNEILILLALQPVRRATSTG